MSTPKLSIVVPTFNRLASLRSTLEPLLASSLFETQHLEILVVDNASDDGTREWLDLTPGLRVERNSSNVGIEGNIVLGLLRATGEYVWLLSDHMIVEMSGLEWLLTSLCGEAAFEVAYARIADYPSLMPTVGETYELGALPRKVRARLPVIIGNISTMVVRRELLSACFRSVFRFSGFSYPHLGIFVHLDEHSRLIELPTMSAFAPTKIHGGRVSYDMFKSRFLGLPRALRALSRLNPLFYPGGRALGLQRGALFHDLMLSVGFAEQPAFGAADLAECLRYYRGLEFLMIATVLASLALPRRLRSWTARTLVKHIAPIRFAALKQAATARHADEEIRE